MSRVASSVRRALRNILRAVALLALVLAALYTVMVVLDALKSDILRVEQLKLDGFAMRMVPSALAGRYVFPLPTGGVLRGDYLIVAIITAAVSRGAHCAARSTR